MQLEKQKQLQLLDEQLEEEKEKGIIHSLVWIPQDI
jgi:hypothetical protein